MIINLKQNEIEAALRAYVVAQGISLQGKDLSISFTAGRKETGISAEICIDDVEIPGFSNVEEEAPETTQAAMVVTLQSAITTVTSAAEAEADALEAVTEEPAAAVKEDAPEAKATASLFG